MVPVAGLPFNTSSPATSAVAMDILDPGLTHRNPDSENFGIYSLWGDPPLMTLWDEAVYYSKALVQKQIFPKIS